MGLPFGRRPEPAQLRQSAHGVVKPSSQPYMSHGVGMKVVGVDGQAGRVDSIVGVRDVDDSCKAHAARAVLDKAR